MVEKDSASRTTPSNLQEFQKAERFLQSILERVHDTKEQRILDEQGDFYDVHNTDASPSPPGTQEPVADIFATNQYGTHFDETILINSGTEMESMYNNDRYDVSEIDTVVSQGAKNIPNMRNDTSNVHCMSMTQPWASLLVRGIKRYEGRSWNTKFRGRLWIASTQQSPDTAVIHKLQSEYSQLYHIPTDAFPTSYPTGCIVGYVYVDDVLTQEQFQQLRADLLRRTGEDVENSTNEYVFVCSRFTVLQVPVPITGKHKIYTLPKETCKYLHGMFEAGMLVQSARFNV
uniref:Activating signal cointegrator 1 n=1 Tax=Lygus hesperus TaxID=30085 RepID=A0A0A9X3K9_LYGHE